MKDYHWAAIPIVVLGTGIVLWAGYKAGQKNASAPKQISPAPGDITAEFESIDTPEVNSDIEAALIQSAVASAL